MKLSAKILTALLCLSMLAGSLVSCGVTLKPGAEGLYDNRNKITYIHASPVYEAVALVKEYGKMNVTSKESYQLYTIPDTDPTKMVATEEFDILYASDTTMPTLAEMIPSVLHVCVDGSSTSSEICRIEDAVDISILVSEYTTNEPVPYPGLTALRRYRVRFESTSYPGFYYSLVYMEYSEDLVIDGVNCGKYFLYSAFEDRFIPVSDVIHTAMGFDQ